jgi:hypothetical protein
MARAKNRQTFNKVARERELKERRALKQAKKDERKRLAAEGEETGTDAEGTEPGYAVDDELARAEVDRP